MTVFTVLLLASKVNAQSWSDRSEYDIVLAIRSEAIPAKRLALLETWKQRYPTSEFHQVRAELQLSTYEGLGDTTKMLGVAREIVTKNPRSFFGLYWLTVLSPGMTDPNPDLLAQAAQAASTLLTEAPDFFSLDRKPTGSAGADWQNQRVQTDVQARRTLGWVHWQRGNYDAAEAEFRKILQLDPKQTDVSSWLGIVLALQKTPEKRLEAIWHLGRAAYLDSGSSLSPAERGEARSLFERAYSVYHGSSDGMDQIGMATMAAVMPPADFRVETAQQANVRKQEEELARTNPELLAWIRIRRQLEGPDSQRNFAALTALPMRLKGFVVRQLPAKRPKELGIGLQDPTIEELVLKLDLPLTGSAEPGTPIEFEATPISFTSDPFLLYATGKKATLMGWSTSQK